MIRLSVCIPTYNFAAFIGETLRAVTEQAGEGVEVVVLDGGSTDDTPAIVGSFSRDFPGLVYQRLDRPGGIDADIARVVDLARGEYIWLLSSDDVPVPGAIDRLRSALSSDDDVYLLNRVECDVGLRPLRVSPWLPLGIGDATIRLSEPTEVERYLRSARSIGALFSYMSSVVVRRSAWKASPPASSVIGTNYAHVARLFSMLRKGRTLRYVETPLVLCRGENDSFARSGMVRRFAIDLDGYRALGDLLFSEPHLRKAWDRVMRREHPWYVYAEVRSRTPSRREWTDFRSKLFAAGYARWQVAVVGTMGAVAPLMVLARIAWFGARRIKRWVMARPYSPRGPPPRGRGGEPDPGPPRNLDVPTGGGRPPGPSRSDLP